MYSDIIKKKNTYFFFIVVVLSFVLNPFLKKKAIGELNPHEFLIFNHILSTIVLFFIAFFFFYFQICDIKCFQKINNNHLFWTIISSFLSIIGSISFIILLQREEVTYLIPNINPFVLVLASVFGFFVFSETMSKFKIIGIILILFGTMLINYDKLKRN